MVATAGRDSLVHIWQGDTFQHRYTLCPLVHLDEQPVDILPPIASLQTPSLAQRGIETPRASVGAQRTSRKQSALYATDMAWVAAARQLFVCALGVLCCMCVLTGCNVIV